MQQKSVFGKLPFVNCLQFLTLLLPKPVSDGEFGVCKIKKQLWAHWHCVWLQIQIGVSQRRKDSHCLHSSERVHVLVPLRDLECQEDFVTVCDASLWKLCLQRGHRYAWLRFPWRFLVPHYHRWILQRVFLCLTFSSFLFCFVWFCLGRGQKDFVVFLIVWGLFLWVWFIFFLLVLTSCELFGFFCFWSKGRGKQLFYSVFVGRMSCGCCTSGFSYKLHPWLVW